MGSAIVVAVLTLAGFSVAIAGLTPTAAAAEHCDATVDEDGSIQAAIDAAEAGDTICVEAGTYAEDVDVHVPDVTLAGPHEGLPGHAPQRSAGQPAGEATVTGQVVLTADGATLDGFDVSPPPAEANSASEAVRVSGGADGVIVQNNVVRDFGEDGLGAWLGVEGIVAFGGDAGDPIEDVTIADNHVHGIEGLDEQGGAAGIMIQGNVLGATVEGNLATEIGREQTAWGQGVVVTGTGNHGQVPHDVQIVDNELSDVLANPDTPWHGVGVGIETAGSSYQVVDNRIEDNELGVEVKAGAEETEVTGNLIEGHDKLGALNTDEASLDATGNWWGSPLGPTHESNGFTSTGLTGDEVSDGVSFDPWCVDPACAVGSGLT